MNVHTTLSDALDEMRETGTCLCSAEALAREVQAAWLHLSGVHTWVQFIPNVHWLAPRSTPQTGSFGWSVYEYDYPEPGVEVTYG